MVRKIEFIRNVYRAVLPGPVRDSRLITKLKQQLPHDWLYNSSYYSTTVEDPAIQSAPRIADSIMETFNPKTVVDVGCGTGALLEVLGGRGCEVFGLEYSEVGLQYCREKRKLPVDKFDLENDHLTNDRAFDIAICLEVAEHLPASAADKFVSILTSLSSKIVFTAAHPGQGGADHVNEQPAGYWISKFNRRGFQHLQQVSSRWRESWQAFDEVAPWYCENLMLFQKDVDA
jgi:SAM-dependent methyltransferase